MQVVILAAGRGERFSRDGYVLPKPLIPVRGKAMIQYAVENVLPLTDEPIIICPAHLKFNIWGLAQTICSPQIIGVKHTQSGAALSLLSATAALDEQQPVMVVDCDSIVSPSTLTAFASWATTEFTDHGATSALVAFRPLDGSARYSFVEHTGSLVRRVVEKRRVSEVATAGIHSWASWLGLRHCVASAAAAGDTLNGELYLAPVHNYSERALLYEIRADELHSVGTPEQLEAYEQETSSVK